MNRIIVQALYVAKSGKTYRSQTKAVDEGKELFDFENELKYQLAMRDYPIEFVNEHGHRQFIQPTDLETIIAAQFGYEVQAVAPVQEERLEPQTPSWATQDILMDIPDENKPDMMFIGVDPAGSEGIVVIEHKFNTHLPFPEPPVQKVRVKPTGDDPDNETTQEIPLPFAGPSAVRRTIAQNDPQGPARMAAYGSVKVRLGAGTDPNAPTP